MGLYRSEYENTGEGLELPGGKRGALFPVGERERMRGRNPGSKMSSEGALFGPPGDDGKGFS